VLRYFLPGNYFRNLIYTVPAILIAISVHEYAHGYVSYKLGDPTPKRDGRLTLNPFAHMDPAGTICLLLFRMGWAKPVRVNAACYKNKRTGLIMVSLAGPVMNYLAAFLVMLVYGFCYKNGYSWGIFFYYIATVNIGLGTFNLIPISPLDGSNVLSELFPKVRYVYYRIRRYAPFILLGCMAIGILRWPMKQINSWILNGMWSAVRRMLEIGIKVPSAGLVV